MIDTWQNFQSLIQLLEFNGCAMDGVTDDHDALQQVLYLFNPGNRGQIIVPEGITFKVNSPLIIPGGLEVIDWNGATFDFSSLGSGYAFSFLQNSYGSPWSQWEPCSPMRNFTLIGPQSESSNADGLFLGVLTGGGQVSGQTLVDFSIIGFRDGLTIGSYSWINNIRNGNISNCWRQGVIYNADVQAGEQFSWHGGRIANCVKSDGSGCGIRMTATGGGNKELNLYGVSLDYNNLQFDVQGGRLRSFGGHIEDNHYGQPLGNIAWTGGNVPTGFYSSGDTIVTTESSANSRPYLFTVSGDNAGIVARSNFDTYNSRSQLIQVLSGTPHIDLDGSVVVFNGSTQFPTIGSALNRLGNPGFELGSLGGWASSGSGYTFSADNTVPHLGAWAGKMTSVNAQNGSLRQGVPCRPGQKVYWRAWLNVTAISAGSVEIKIAFVTADGLTTIQNVNSTSFTAPTSGYVVQQGQVGVPAGAAIVQIQLYGFGFTGTAFLDDCELHVI